VVLGKNGGSPHPHKWWWEECCPNGGSKIATRQTGEVARADCSLSPSGVKGLERASGAVTSKREDLAKGN